MVVRKKRIKLSREVIHNLKEISKLSSVKQWEFAGNIEYKNFNFSRPTLVTSKKRNRVESPEIERVWYSEISYHTHPGIGWHGESVSHDTPVFTTLPSNADFEAYIKGFPKMQVNIICDARGYYVINILKSAYIRASPLPNAVQEYMRKMRSTPFMRICAFSDDGVEYFQTTIKNWKRQINEGVNEDMMKLFGISIKYYGYDEDPPIVTVYRDIDVV
tara:strand:+ start:562 stop:1212 length:651 start_codon:yes stop_codon:yes gene_type:complete